MKQARLHDFFLNEMFKSGLEPRYGFSLSTLKQDSESQGLRATLSFTRPTGQQSNQVVKAHYVMGCDGARSKVRKCPSLDLRGDFAHAARGVADILVDSDFPDLRFKSIFRSKSLGTLQIIPREGGYLIRVYVGMDRLHANERVAQRGFGFDDIIHAAKNISRAYTFQVKECLCWSICKIGQQLTDRFDNGNAATQPDASICGVACHTRSPKAGQGINVSMQDALNLGWQLVQ